jgi:hypothetical protein
LTNPNSPLLPPSPSLPPQAEGYNPKKSRVSDDTLADFYRSPFTGDITEVPGIGPAAAKALATGEADDKITNSFQLVGKFLALKGPDSDGHKVESVEHMEKFWYFLQEKVRASRWATNRNRRYAFLTFTLAASSLCSSQGIKAHRSAIVNAIAEKMNTMMPGIYDADAYEDDEDDE